MFTFLSSAVYSYSYAHSLRSFTCFAGPFLRRQCRPHFLRTFYTCLIHLTGYRLGFVIGDGKSVTYQPAAHIIREPGQGASESERLSERKRATLIIRRLFLPSVISYGFPLLLFRNIMFERFNLVWIIHVREIYSSYD